MPKICVSLYLKLSSITVSVREWDMDRVILKKFRKYLFSEKINHEAKGSIKEKKSSSLKVEDSEVGKRKYINLASFLRW